MAQTRRDFLKGAAAGIAGTAALAGSGTGLAFAQDLQDEGCSWAGEEIQIDESQIVETIDCEALVVGGGTGGLFTAAFLADMGVKVLLIEKLTALSWVKGDLGALNSRFVEEHGDHMDPATVFHQLVDYSAGRADTRLIKLWMEQSPKAIEALDDMLQKYNYGYVYHDGGYAQLNGWEGPVTAGAYTKNPTGHHVKVNTDVLPEAKTTTNVLSQIVTDNGCEIRLGLGMVKLEHDGRKVTGIIAQDWETEEYVRINAEKGVVVATGGYQGNPEVFNKLQPDTALFMPAPSAGGCTGDGQRACLWLGAAVDEIHTSMLFERRALFPGEFPPNNIESDYKSCNLGSQPFLKLNCFGDRFTNESQPYDYILHTIANYPQHIFCEVFDSDYAKYIVQFETVGCSRYHAYPSACEDYAAQKDEIIAAVAERVGKQLDQMLEEGYCVKADTIEELAELMQLPVENVVAAVERNNEIAAQGEDPDFYKEAYRLSSIQTPPFYGIRFCGRMLCTMDGVLTDTSLRPLDKQGEAFDGVYVIGDCSGGMFTHTYPNLFTGLAAGRTLTWAWLVAQEIAE